MENLRDDPSILFFMDDPYKPKEEIYYNMDEVLKTWREIQEKLKSDPKCIIANITGD